MTDDRWEHLREARSKYTSSLTIRGIALPPLSFEPVERARRVKGSYNPAKFAKGHPSRVARWSSALSDAKDAIEELIGIRDEYQEWQSNLPENLADGTLADKLAEVCDFQFEDALEVLEEAENLDLPRGFGRD